MIPSGHGLIPSGHTLASTGRFAPTDWILVGLVVVLVAGSAGLSMAETSLLRTTRAKALALEDDGRRGARHLVALIEHPQAFLNPVLLLIMVCQLTAATLVGVLGDRWFGALGVVVATLFEVVVVFVLAEALPKNWAVRNPEHSALRAAPVIFAVISFVPIRWLSNGLVGLANLMLGSTRRHPKVSESEILAMADVALEEEVIEREERALIHSVIEFGDTIVREVMRPRPDMRSVEAEDTVSEALGVAMSAGFSRLPVHDGNLDDMVGIAYAKDLIRAERDGQGEMAVGSFARAAHFVPETKRVSRLMREMQELKYHMAIVVDEYGGIAGLVTLEDLIEELVGEIVDEYDVEEPPFERLGEDEISVSPRLAVDELSELLGTDLRHGDYDTVGGLLFNVIGHVPSLGEAVDVDGVRLRVEKVQGNRVGRIRVTRAGPDDHSERRATDRAAHRADEHAPNDASGNGPRAESG